MDGNQWGDYLKTVLLLAGIVALAWVVLKYGLPRMPAYRHMASGPVRVVARYPLEPRKTLYIVTVGSECFLLGAADNSIQLLTRVEAASLEPWLSTQASGEQKLDFKSILKGFRK